MPNIKKDLDKFNDSIKKGRVYWRGLDETEFHLCYHKVTGYDAKEGVAHLNNGHTTYGGFFFTEDFLIISWRKPLTIFKLTVSSIAHFLRRKFSKE